MERGFNIGNSFLDEAKALYEWEYAKQMLYTQLMRDTLHKVLEGVESLDDAATRLAQEEDVFFSENFLLPRPLLTALTSDEPVVLLIDEIDKAFRGGQGAYTGTMAGAFLLVVLQSILTTLQMEEFGRQIVFGMTLLVLMLFYGRQQRLRV